MKIKGFELSFMDDKRHTFLLQFDRDYGIDRRKGWSVAINGSFYVQLVSNPLTAVWTAIRKHRAAARDMAESEAYQNAGGAGVYWDKADELIKQVQKYTGDWREAFKVYRSTGSTGSVHIDSLIIQHNKSIATAKSLRDVYHGK